MRKEQGQASLLIALMLSTFLMLFLFVLNTGILINAKINLQNAADMAAYSGAATQARQLNAISYLNYEMRRQYKKLLFRYYVMGGFGFDDRPGAGGNGPRQWIQTESGGSTTHSLGVPVACFDGFNYDSNNLPERFCRNYKAPQVVRSAGTPWVPLINVIDKQAQILDQIVQQNCSGIAYRNLSIVRKWLWNLDPDYSVQRQELEAKLKDPSLTAEQRTFLGALYTTINGQNILASGVGLIPKNLMILNRIKTLMSYVNQPAQQALTREAVRSLEKAPDSFRNERTIQSFLSAFNTLGEHTFPGEDIVMDELLPGLRTPNIKDPLLSSVNLLSLQLHKIDFDLWGMQYGAGTAKSANCQANAQPYPIRAVPVAVSKDPEYLTYYALRLKAKVRMLVRVPFLSKGEYEVSAYAAAQPFGSRIGPPFKLEEFTQAKMPTKDAFDPQEYANQSAPIPPYVGRIPNVPVRAPGDVVGFNELGFQGDLSRMLAHKSDPKYNLSLPDIGLEQIERAYSMAMGPNPYEGAVYNIPHELQDLSGAAELFEKKFYKYPLTLSATVATWNPPGSTPSSTTVFHGTNERFAGGSIANEQYALWAPLVSNDSGIASIDQVKNSLTQSINDFYQYVFQNPGAPGVLPMSQQEKQALQIEQTETIRMLAIYLSKIAAAKTADLDGEALNYLRISNPIAPDFRGQPVSTQFFARDPAQIRTSWVNTRNSEVSSRGRTGYSVKFVSFDFLKNRSVPTTNFDGVADSWKNFFDDTVFGSDQSGAPLEH